MYDMSVENVYKNCSSRKFIFKYMSLLVSLEKIFALVLETFGIGNDIVPIGS